MKQNHKNGAYSIAWFKIADCVLRGEKERALGVHRLLAHSLDDDALVMQLEGDIMFACGDFERALQAYNDAAEKYTILKKYEQAAGIYEHMIFIRPVESRFYTALLRAYTAAGITQQIVRVTLLYITVLKDTTDALFIKKTIEDIMPLLNESLQVLLARQLLEIDFLKTTEIIFFEQYLVNMVIDVYLQNNESAKIEHFIDYLQQSKPQLAAYALDYRGGKV